MPIPCTEGEQTVPDWSEHSPGLADLDLEACMHAALDEAEQAGLAGEVPIGAVLVVNGAIVSRGRARHWGTQSQLAHAEMEALLNGGESLWRDYSRAVLFTTREPCPMCLGAAVMADVPHIIFAAPDPIVHAADTIESNPYVRRHIKMYRGGVLEAAAHYLTARFERTYRRCEPGTAAGANGDDQDGSVAQGEVHE